MLTRFYQPQVQVLYCEREVLQSWNYPELRAPFWRLYRNEDAVNGGGAGALAAVFFKAWQKGPEENPPLRVMDLEAQATTAENGARLPRLERVKDEWRLDITPGSLILIPPETAFRTRACVPFHQFYLHFQALPPFDRVPVPCLEIPGGSPAATAFHQGIDALAAQIEAQRCGTHTLIARGETQAPLPFALGCHALALSALRAVPPSLLTPPVLEPRVAEALVYLRGKLDRTVPVTELAARARMHPHAFNALFKRHTGATITQWHLAERIARACVLLSFTSQGIAEIAAASGFVDRYHFTRVFTRLRGVGPARYRREVT